MGRSRGGYEERPRGMTAPAVLYGAIAAFQIVFGAVQAASSREAGPSLHLVPGEEWWWALVFCGAIALYAGGLAAGTLALRADSPSRARRRWPSALLVVHGISGALGCVAFVGHHRLGA
jgi:hypothetical protein